MPSAAPDLYDSWLAGQAEGTEGGSLYDAWLREQEPEARVPTLPPIRARPPGTPYTPPRTIADVERETAGLFKGSFTGLIPPEQRARRRELEAERLALEPPARPSRDVVGRTLGRVVRAAGGRVRELGELYKLRLTEPPMVGFEPEAKDFRAQLEEAKAVSEARERELRARQAERRRGLPEAGLPEKAGELAVEFLRPEIIAGFVLGDKMAVGAVRALARRGVPAALKLMRAATARPGAGIAGRAGAAAVHGAIGGGAGLVGAETLRLRAEEGRAPTFAEAAGAFVTGEIITPPLAAVLGPVAGGLARYVRTARAGQRAPQELIRLAQAEEARGGLFLSEPDRAQLAYELGRRGYSRQQPPPAEVNEAMLREVAGTPQDAELATALRALRERAEVDLARRVLQLPERATELEADQAFQRLAGTLRADPGARQTYQLYSVARRALQGKLRPSEEPLDRALGRMEARTRELDAALQARAARAPEAAPEPPRLAPEPLGAPEPVPTPAGVEIAAPAPAERAAGLVDRAAVGLSRHARELADELEGLAAQGEPALPALRRFRTRLITESLLSRGREELERAATSVITELEAAQAAKAALEGFTPLPKAGPPPPREPLPVGETVSAVKQVAIRLPKGPPAPLRPAPEPVAELEPLPPPPPREPLLRLTTEVEPAVEPLRRVERPPEAVPGEPEPTPAPPEAVSLARIRELEATPAPEPIPTPAAVELPRGLPAPGQVGVMHSDLLVLAPERMQYKRELPGERVPIREWNRALAGTVAIWQDPAGQALVANGYLRVRGAKATGGQELTVFHIPAENEAQARVMGALINIAENSGTAVDAGKLFRELGADAANELLARSGIQLRGRVGGRIAREGLALARLPEPLFQQVATGSLTLPRGVALGESGLSGAQMEALAKRLGSLRREPSPDELAELVRLAKEAPTVAGAELTLFGEEAFERSLLAEKAEVSGYVRRQITADKRLFRPLSEAERAERIAELGAGQVSAERAGELATSAARAEQVYLTLSTRSGPVADALNDAATRLSRGEDPNATKRAAYTAIRAALEGELAAATGRPVRGAGGLDVASAVAARPVPEPGAAPAERAPAEPVAPPGEVVLPARQVGEELPPWPTLPPRTPLRGEATGIDIDYYSHINRSETLEQLQQIKRRLEADPAVRELPARTGTSILTRLMERTVEVAEGRAAAEQRARERRPKLAPPAGPPGQPEPPAREPLTRASVEDIDLQRATDAYRWNSMDPGRRGAQEREDYVAHMQELAARLEPLADTPEKRTLLTDELERYRQKYLAFLSKRLAATGRTASAMVTGPSKFPTQKNQKALDAERRIEVDFQAWQGRAQKAIKQKLAPEGTGRISADVPDAPEQLRARIAEAEQLQQRMREGNKVVRQTALAPDEKVERLVALGFEEQTARSALKPDELGRLGFPDFLLRNRATNIRRMKARLSELEAARAKETSERTFAGGRIVENVEENRLQLFFDAKPEAELRQRLKSAGFKWAPSVGAWQRQLTENARASLSQLRLPELREPPPTAAREEVTPLAAPAAEGPERVVAAAIRLTETSEEFSGFSHADAWHKANEAHGGRAKPSYTMGFLTSTERFVDDREALEIARRAAQGALLPGRKRLTSEDIRGLAEEAPEFALTAEAERVPRAQGELLPEPAMQGMSQALAQAKATLSLLEGKVQRGQATAAELTQYREALSLVRRQEGMSAEEIRRLMAEAGGPQAPPGERPLDLFAEEAPVELARPTEPAPRRRVSFEATPPPAPRAERRARGVEEQQLVYGDQATAEEVVAEVARVSGPAARYTLDGVPTMAERLRTAPKAAVKGGYVSIHGQDVSTPEQRLRVFYPFRNPRNEIMHTGVFGPDGRLVAVEGLTSGMVDMVSYARTAEGRRQIERVARRAKKLGATDVFDLHNHPSGRIEPSPNDEELAVWRAGIFAEKGLRYHGMHIIDNEAGSQILVSGLERHLDAQGRLKGMGGDVDVRTFRIGEPKPGDWTEQGPVLHNTAEVAALIKAANQPATSFLVVYVSAAAKAVAAEPHRLSALGTIAEWLPNHMRATGAQRVILVTGSADAAAAATPAVRATREQVLATVKRGEYLPGLVRVVDIVHLEGERLHSALGAGEISSTETRQRASKAVHATFREEFEAQPRGTLRRIGAEMFARPMQLREDVSPVLAGRAGGPPTGPPGGGPPVAPGEPLRPSFGPSDEVVANARRLAPQVAREVRGSGERVRGAERGRVGLAAKEAMSRPEQLLERTSETLRVLGWRELLVADDRRLRLLHETEDALDRALTDAIGGDVSSKAFADWASERIQTPIGRITRDEATQIVTLARDPDNARVLARAGARIQLPNARPRQRRVGPAELAELERLIGEPGMRYSDFLAGYYDTSFPDQINPGWLRAHGTEIFPRGVARVPRSVDESVLQTDPLGGFGFGRDPAVLAWRHLVPREGEAPLTLRGATEEFLRHAYHVSRIAAYAEPVALLGQVLGTPAVNVSLERAVGKAGYRRIVSAIRHQVTPVVDRDAWGRLMRQVTANFARAKLGARLGPATVTQAGLIVDAAYELGGHGKLAKAAMEFARDPVGEWRENDRIGMEFSPYWRERKRGTTRELMGGVLGQPTPGVAPAERAAERALAGAARVGEVAMTTMRKADQLTMTLAMKLARREVAERMPELAVGSDEWGEAVARNWKERMMRGESTSAGIEMSGAIAYGREHAFFAPMVQFLSGSSKVYSLLPRASWQLRQGDTRGAIRSAGTFLVATGYVTVVRLAVGGVVTGGTAGTVYTAYKQRRLAGVALTRFAEDVARYVPLVGNTFAGVARGLTGEPGPEPGIGGAPEDLATDAYRTLLAAGHAGIAAWTKELDAKGESVVREQLIKVLRYGPRLLGNALGLPTDAVRDAYRATSGWSGKDWLKGEPTPAGEIRKLAGKAEPEARREARAEVQLRRRVYGALRKEDREAFSDAVVELAVREETGRVRATQLRSIVTARYGGLDQLPDSDKKQRLTAERDRLLARLSEYLQDAALQEHIEPVRLRERRERRERRLAPAR